MNNDYRDFLLRLKEERLRCGLTQQQLCCHTETTQGCFSRAETGLIRLSFTKLKGVCDSGMDIFYAFTGNKAADRLDFPEPSTASPEELLSLLGIVYIHANAVRIRSRALSGASAGTHPGIFCDSPFGRVWEQLSYLQYLSGNTKTNRNILYCLRIHYGYTQWKMADLLGMDIKRLRSLEKGRRLPDSEVIWRLYDQFHVSPAFILNDPRGLWNELNYVLGLLEDTHREAILRILKDSHDLIWA